MLLEILLILFQFCGMHTKKLQLRNTTLKNHLQIQVNVIKIKILFFNVYCDIFLFYLMYFRLKLY